MSDEDIADIAGTRRSIQLHPPLVRSRARTHACCEPVPPQSTVMVDVVASQVPVQPARSTVPSVSAAPVTSPLLSIAAATLMAGLEAPNGGCCNRILQTSWRRHCA